MLVSTLGAFREHFNAFYKYYNFAILLQDSDVLKCIIHNHVSAGTDF